MTPTDSQRIHDTSLRLLADPGVRLESDAVVEKLLAHGAQPTPEPHTVRIPAAMVADALASAPSDVHLADRRSPGYNLGEPSRIWSSPGLNWHHHGRTRPFTSADMAAYARLLDRLPAVDGVFGVAMKDVPPQIADVVGLRIMAANTTKHIRVLCASVAGAEALCRMLPVLGDGAWFSIGFTAHGPLRWTKLALDIFAVTAGRGIPVSLNGEPMAGASGPVTLAGSAAVGNAEILAGLVVNQVLEPGRPCIYNLGLAHVLDMRKGEPVTGGPENHLLAEASAAMGRFYGLPSCSWVSTEALCCDAQAAIEKSLGWKTHLDAGVSLLWGLGQLESEMTVSPAMAVIDQEILDYVARLRRGIEVTDDTLAEAVTREVGIGGEFLSHDHTLAHFRTELYEPQVLWRGKRELWQSLGEPDLAQRAEEVADRLMTPLEAPLITDEQDAELERIIAGLG